MPLKTHRDDAPTLNLTPMIDILFLLIIFFMVGTRFSDMERSLELDVPRISTAATLTAAPMRRVINVYRDGRIALDRDFVSLDELQTRLATAHSEYEELGVVVRGDGDGPLQNVATVLGACRDAGISDLGISVRLAQKESH